MKPRRTPHSNKVFELEGGNEDNSLWVEVTVEEATGAPVIRSEWELNDEERAEIADGARVYLRGYAILRNAIGHVVTPAP